MKTIVVSAVNIRKGGTLTILRECLSYLSALALQGDYRIVAIVHKKELADFNNIEYIEIPNTIKGWGRRLWCEYVTMYKISLELSPVSLWLSLHDTSPRVKADRQAVYCQTSFPFLRLKAQDLLFDPKVVLFALFTKYAYRINIRRNRYVIVQTEWLRRGFSKMFNLPTEKIIVAPPEKKTSEKHTSLTADNRYHFIFISTPDCHKNFETLFRAAEMLGRATVEFKVTVTISGMENRYSRWLYKKWGHLKEVEFAGYLTKDKLTKLYASADCLVFPSRVETWGLPISEFSVYDKPMLLADLPYAHETATGSNRVAFFNPLRPSELKEMMFMLTQGNYTFLSRIGHLNVSESHAPSWKKLFEILMK